MIQNPGLAASSSSASMTWISLGYIHIADNYSVNTSSDYLYLTVLNDANWEDVVAVRLIFSGTMKTSSYSGSFGIGSTSNTNPLVFSPGMSTYTYSVFKTIYPYDGQFLDADSGIVSFSYDINYEIDEVDGIIPESGFVTTSQRLTGSVLGDASLCVSSNAVTIYRGASLYVCALM